MASACVNNIGMSPENFLNCPPAKFPSYGWLSPRISFSREFPDDEASKASANKPSNKNQTPMKNVEAEKPDPDISGVDFVDFEFRLEDPVTMLPADELFSDGKLMPLQFSTLWQSTTSAPASSDVRSPDTLKFRMKNEISSTDPYLFSPKAPRCSSRWKELLGLKKLYQNSSLKNDGLKTTSSLSSDNNHSNRNASRGLKHFLHRSSKSSDNSSINLPLLRDTDIDSVSISARLSLSSSSSGHEHDDLPRLSLDSDKPRKIARNAHQTASKLSRVRHVKHRASLSSENATAAMRAGRSPMRRDTEATTARARGVSVDSPRMNSSGKIVFHSLERSSSSPSTFNGGPRYKYRGMERSYSANIRVTPVLNVPVCSLRGSSKSGVFGLPLFSSQQKKDNVGGNRNQVNHSKNRVSDRI